MAVPQSNADAGAGVGGGEGGMRADAGRGGSMQRRRARSDRYYDYARSIELAADGEGVQTCTREVKAGEVTRTGLQI
jgi:hypothetical protein